MIASINAWLIGALIVGILFQPSAPRFYSALVISVMYQIHSLFFWGADAFLYYGSAGLLELVAVFILAFVSNPPKMTIDLLKINLAFVFVNLFGYLLWFFYYPPLIYNVLCAVLYTLILITFILRDKKDVGNFAVHSWRSCFRFNRNLLSFNSTNYDKKI